MTRPNREVQRRPGTRVAVVPGIVLPSGRGSAITDDTVRDIAKRRSRASPGKLSVNDS